MEKNKLVAVRHIKKFSSGPIKYLDRRNISPEWNAEKWIRGQTHLDISGNDLDVLPPEISRYINITLLKLNQNNLTNLPPEIGKLLNLTRLDLSHNSLRLLPPEIGELEKLSSLELRNNQLASLPSEISLLSELQEIMILLKTLEKSRTTIYTPVCTGEFRKAPVYGGEKRPKKVFQSFQLDNTISTIKLPFAWISMMDSGKGQKWPEG